MKRFILIGLGIMCLVNAVLSQSNRERRLYLNDYVAPEELVSMSKSLPFDKAMSLFSEFSKKYMNKIVVDATNTKTPIGIDIENTYWLQAFEQVLRAKKLWYDEREEFFYVYAPADSASNYSTGGGGGGTPAKADSAGRLLMRQRDVRISSVFFTVDVIKSLNAGINWDFFYSGDSTAGTPTKFGATFNGGATDIAATGGNGFVGRVVPAIKFSNITALISFFADNQLGNVLSGPSIVVSSGKLGHIQVGQDIYITTKDFAGNTIQQPVSSGIIIDVTPTVYEEKGIKFINLAVKAERSTVSAGPIINKSSANTYTVLYDGEETVIGGLYSNSETTERGGIPFLKDLPWWFFGLRYIFGFDNTSVSKQELIILLKAEVIPTIEERIANAEKNLENNPIERERARNAKEIERLKVKEQ